MQEKAKLLEDQNDEKNETTGRKNLTKAKTELLDFKKATHDEQYKAP